MTPKALVLGNAVTKILARIVILEHFSYRICVLANQAYRLLCNSEGLKSMIGVNCRLICSSEQSSADDTEARLFHRSAEGCGSSPCHRHSRVYDTQRRTVCGDGQLSRHWSKVCLLLKVTELFTLNAYLYIIISAEICRMAFGNVDGHWSQMTRSVSPF